VFNNNLEAPHCRILIVGCNCILRKGFASVVRGVIPHAAFVEAYSLHDAKGRLACEEFAAAVFDIDVGDPIEPISLKMLRADHPHLILGVLSRLDNADIILSYLAAGVNGYILGCSSQSEIECAVGAIFRGAIYVPSSLARSNSDQPSQGVVAVLPCRSPRGLTRRQTAVLDLLLDGCSNKQIAKELNLSPHTVKIHVGALLRLFAVRRRSDLSAAASRTHNNNADRNRGPSLPEAPPDLRIIA
jgi:DNA-binding NarL/FixJ family response regulator